MRHSFNCLTKKTFSFHNISVYFSFPKHFFFENCLVLLGVSAYSCSRAGCVLYQHMVRAHVVHVCVLWSCVDESRKLHRSVMMTACVGRSPCEYKMTPCHTDSKQCYSHNSTINCGYAQIGVYLYTVVS